MARRRAQMRQRLGGDEQVVQRVDAQHAGAADRGVVDQVGAGERAGVRGRGGLALRRAAGLDDEHRLVARRRARGRHELARLLDRLDVEQDRARARVARQPVEHVAEIDVGMLAERDEVREADAAAARPVEHRGDERARLRDEGQAAGFDIRVREARVQLRMRRQQAEVVGAEDTQQVRPRGVEHGLLLRGVEARGEHDRRARAALAKRGDEAGHGSRRRRDHRQLGRGRQAGHVGITRLAVELLVLRVHRPARAGEAAVTQVAPDRRADAVRPNTGADQGYRRRIEQGIEMADAHDGRR